MSQITPTSITPGLYLAYQPVQPKMTPSYRLFAVFRTESTLYWHWVNDCRALPVSGGIPANAVAVEDYPGLSQPASPACRLAANQ